MRLRTAGRYAEAGDHFVEQQQHVSLCRELAQRFEAAAFDLLGREVFTWNVTDNESASSISLDLSGVAPGVYLVRVSWDGGSDVRVLTVTR